MNISFRWLRSFFPPGALDTLSPEDLAARLTMQGLPVDDVRRPFAEFSGVVLARVLAARPHPKADRLTLCTVAAGSRDGEREVVCGAPNVEVGAMYGYATVGARLPGGREIHRAKIRGIESEGMLCSAPELGLDPLGSADGIWPIVGASEADLGRGLREVLALDDAVLVVDVASNRGDALSHWGIAREVQWVVDAECALPPIILEEVGPPATDRAGVSVEDVEGCPLYLGRVVEGLRVGPSPGWLQARLLAVGQRPINNVVDATNFVMLECGQPLHPFDFARLAQGRIVVRPARPGERLTTLDGKERALDPEMTMIADPERVVAIGGVMGGSESVVQEDTTVVFLEGAHFDRIRVGQTARRLSLTTEASTRFARGVDPEITGWALDRSAALIAEWARGVVAPGRVGEERRVSREGRRVALRVGRLEALVGRPIPGAEARSALSTLGFAIEGKEGGIVATVPSWRFDVEREIDLIEEVARLTGYDAVPLVPLPAPPVAPAVGEDRRRDGRLGAAARAAGFDEARTPSFVGGGVLGSGFPLDKMVEIRNPISRADRFLRPLVITTLGRAVAYNLKRGATRVKLYEFGHSFAPSRDAGTPIAESRSLALVAAGARAPIDWSMPDPPPYDFFDLKGDVEDVLGNGASVVVEFVAGGRSYLHSGRQAEIVSGDGARIGFCGELHPEVARSWETEGRLFVAELDLAALPSSPPVLVVREVPREPAIERDLALVVPETDRCADVLAAVEAAAIAHLTAFQVFDRYRGPQVAEGHYSLGLRLTFQADRTLTDEEVDSGIEQLVQYLAEERGYHLR